VAGRDLQALRDGRERVLLLPVLVLNLVARYKTRLDEDKRLVRTEVPALKLIISERVLLLPVLVLDLEDYSTIEVHSTIYAEPICTWGDPSSARLKLGALKKNPGSAVRCEMLAKPSRISRETGSVKSQLKSATTFDCVVKYI
jgi:hypothetical protein